MSAEIEHGTPRGYQSHRCRCPACRAAHSAYMQQWRAQNQPTKFHKMQHRIDTLEAALRALVAQVEAAQPHSTMVIVLDHAYRALESS